MHMEIEESTPSFLSKILPHHALLQRQGVSGAPSKYKVSNSEKCSSQHPIEWSVNTAQEFQMAWMISAGVEPRETVIIYYISNSLADQLHLTGKQNSVHDLRNNTAPWYNDIIVLHNMYSDACMVDCTCHSTRVCHSTGIVHTAAHLCLQVCVRAHIGAPARANMRMLC